MNKRKKVIAFSAAGLAAVLIISGIAIAILRSRQADQIVYKETTVSYGNLTVGITEDGSVDVGAETQSFELDISALVRNSDDQSNTGSAGSSGNMSMGGGQDMFNQVFNLAGSSGSNYTSSSENSLVVDEVCVSVSQKVSVGDVLYTLTQDSVDQIRDQLQSDVTAAQNDIDEIETDQVTSRLTAKQTYETSVAYGGYAQTEYEQTLSDLQEKLNTAQTSLDQANEELAESQADLEELLSQLATANKNYKVIADLVADTDTYADTYTYLYYYDYLEDAQDNIDSIQKEIDTLEDTIEKTNDSITDLQSQLVKAERDYDQGALTAKKTYDLRLLANNYASETYDLTLSYLDMDLLEAQNAYETASEKLAKFDASIVDGQILSDYNGVITAVSLAGGDEINANTALIEIYNEGEGTIQVNVTSDNMEQITLGDQVNVNLTAYPDTVFTGEVTDIDDAVTDSSTGETYYPVTVTFQGDGATFFEGMSGEVTFITKETKEVLYVSNRAIIREGTDSYVLRKDESGKFYRQEVTTGFSDGINVAITEGLSEGDVVLIESKVTVE